MVKKYANQLRIINEKLKISTVELPNKDINETLQLHENEIFTELLEQRKEVPFLFLIEDFSIENLSQKLLEIESLDDVKPIVKGENISEKIANKQQP